MVIISSCSATFSSAVFDSATTAASSMSIGSGSFVALARLRLWLWPDALVACVNSFDSTGSG